MQLGIPVGVGALTFYVEKVNRKTILIVTYVLIAIIGPVWASLPTDNTALIMFIGFLLCVCTFTNSVTTAAIYCPSLSRRLAVSAALVLLTPSVVWVVSSAHVDRILHGHLARHHRRIHHQRLPGYLHGNLAGYLRC